MASSAGADDLRQGRAAPALARAGLLEPERTGLPARAAGRGAHARAAAHAVIGRFGYLQLDTVSIAGARSHAIVLLSRLAGLDPALPEELLVPVGRFRVLGHEASWIPLELYPVFEFPAARVPPPPVVERPGRRDHLIRKV